MPPDLRHHALLGDIELIEEDSSMAKKAKDVETNERTEREFQLDVNAAVANTEAEIFDDAIGEESLELDGDTSLEDMGEGLEGDDLDEEDEDDTGEDTDVEVQDEDDEDDEAEESEEKDAEAEASDEGEQADETDEGEQPEPERRGVPPGRLRESNERRRQAEERASNLERELAEMRGRVDELSRRPAAPQPQPAQPAADPEPDMFADPSGWREWNQRQADKRAEQMVNDRFTAFERRQAQQREATLNDNLTQAASGPRGFEFQAGYRALTSLDPRDPQNRAMVQRIINSPDPGQAVLDWFEDNGAAEFRDSVLRQLGAVPAPRDARGQYRGQAPSQRQQQPRHVTRLPSLNAAQGHGRQQVQDPEMLDDSDESVFRFATNRG